jgi:hypothetical protein
MPNWSRKSSELLLLTATGICASHVRSLCIFGGRDLDVLYITTSRQKMTPEQLGRYPLSGSVFAV